MKEKTERIIEKGMRVFEIAVFVVSIVFLCLLTCLCAKGQSNVVNREVVSRDTILATDYVHVEEYTTRAGNQSYKAKWCGKAINISRTVAEDILDGSDAYVVLCRYNNGEVIRNKVITLYSE